ncbi:MAG TPA: RNA chaperone Hfq [Candidatus Polarisedimenticolaceae bacterium]|nr:RNA chaperone Hfq [Candidatus Polarisedimenticolaceae bacterium]
MDVDTRNLQNDFFNAARKAGTVVTVFLGNGKRLSGRIKSFDKFTLLLESHYGEQIVFKHAISTVSTSSRAAESYANGEEVHAGAAAKGTRAEGG